MGSSKESAQSELENFQKENPDFLAILEREKVELQVEESKLSQFTFEEASGHPKVNGNEGISGFS